MSRWGLLIVVMLAGTTRAQDAPEKVANPSDALGWALADLATLPPESRPWVRYVWLPPWAYPSWQQTMSFAVNVSANRSSLIQLPTISANGYLLRWDLRTLASTETELAALVSTWDSLATSEPYFHVPNTASGAGANVAIVAPTLKKEHAKLMADLNTSPALPYRADWLLARALTTTEGGCYYELRGIKKSSDKRTDQDFFLAQFGGFESLSQQLNGDQRVAMFESKVTAKPRRVDGFRGVAGRSSTGQIWVTHDIRDNDTEVERHPIYNLLKFDDAAREIIVEGNNGLHVFALFDSAGNLQREVPPDIAKDHTIPPPHTARLQPAISCIRCHGTDDGLKPAPNDVATLLSGRLDAFDDLSNLKSNQLANVQRLAGLYAGDFDRRLRLGRDDYADAVFRVTGGMHVPEASAAVAQIYNDWRYELVDSDQAAYELGWKVPKGTGAKFLQENVQDYPTENIGISFEDVSIAALRQGMPIRRFDFDRVYQDLRSRLKEPAK